jgi:hypothetical protein
VHSFSFVIERRPTIFTATDFLIIAMNSIIGIVFAWLSLDALIAREYGSTRVMLSSIPIVRNAQKLYGLHAQGIMAEIIRV